MTEIYAPVDDFTIGWRDYLGAGQVRLGVGEDVTVLLSSKAAYDLGMRLVNASHNAEVMVSGVAGR